jgi:hypothetical protein
MNFRCEICDAVLEGHGDDRPCDECDARPMFLVPTLEPPRRPKGHAEEVARAWDFAPDGPVLRRG